jgi:hypothetical protein
MRFVALLVAACSVFACAKDRFPSESGAGGSGGATATTTATSTSSAMGEPENSDALCSDGKDNDNNGLSDCCDPACQPTTTPAVTVCAGDGSPEDSDEACSDCIDNDNDGKYVDCEDFDCSKNPAVTVCQ